MKLYSICRWACLDSAAILVRPSLLEELVARSMKAPLQKICDKPVLIGPKAI